MEIINQKSTIRPTKTDTLKINFAERIQAMFLAWAIWDSLGLPVEMYTASQIQEKYWEISDFLPTRENVFFKKHGFDKEWVGFVSDDTILTFAIIKSIIEKWNIDYKDIWEKHIIWYDNFQYGFGKATRNAFEKLKKGFTYKESGSSSTGNGILMKQSPLSAYFIAKNSTDKEIEDIITNICYMTHKHPLPLIASLVHNKMLMTLLMSNKIKKIELLEKLIEYTEKLEKKFWYTDENLDKISDILKQLTSMINIDTNKLEATDKIILETFWRNPDNIKTSGYVYITFGMVYAVFLRDSNEIWFKKMINIWWDVDTYGAIIWNMIWAYKWKFYPDKFIKQLQDKESLLSDIDKFIKILKI